ncbi:GDP-L-fucose synthase family protein [Roseibium sediminis]|uniref:GDP-L-fucose synthase family protein n=1 Tax=Roseibium sediminis TaxID=1775174 RepID=UPI00123E31A4|nr:GDP-L-fucose synthase [Roseibium sediminis]
MDRSSKIYVAGHRGLVGSALMLELRERGYTNLATRSRAELDLTNEAATEAFFATEQPRYVFLAAAKVGGIVANNTYPAEFIRENLAIQTNVIHSAWQNGVKRLLFLGSSCIYPKFSPQPIKEEHLLTGSLEQTNRPYAIAKIAGIETCWSYNRQYGTRYLAVMPTNLYGPGDNYHPENSHVIPALIRKFDHAKRNGEAKVVVWGTGTPRREFLYSRDMAAACVHLMSLSDPEFQPVIDTTSETDGAAEPPLINIGFGTDVTIAELAQLVGEVVGFEGKIVFDPSKPDGTPRKLTDVSKLDRLGWRASTELRIGLKQTYQDFLATEIEVS